MPETMARRILILGGTSDARLLANRLVERHGEAFEVTTSLAGRTSDAAKPAGRIRTGGFGGARGLTDYLNDEAVDLLVDATHPFAAEISAHAAEAATAAGIARLMLVRPAWDIPDGLDVHRVPDLEAAAFALTALETSRVLVTVGHRGLEGLRRFGGHLVVRQIEAHEAPLPLDDALRVIDRPPYTLENELALMRKHGIDGLLTKESGGRATEAKLTAARDLSIPVVMIERPSMPAGEAADSVDGALSWIADRFGG